MCVSYTDDYKHERHRERKTLTLKITFFLSTECGLKSESRACVRSDSNYKKIIYIHFIAIFILIDLFCALETACKCYLINNVIGSDCVMI